ncbi:restriction endonuclease subunit S [Halomonas sp. KM072]
MNSETVEVREVSPGYGFTAGKPALPVGYKQTEVGVIPKDWDVLKFGSLAEIIRGKFSARPRNDPRFYGGNYPFLQTGDVTRSGSKISSFTQTLNEEGVKVSRLFPKGTLFFTIAANIGDIGISEFKAACPDSLVAISPDSTVDKVWLLYELASRKEDFEALASPGAQLNINLEKLRPYLLPVPPLDEQLAIATALRDVDFLLEDLDRLIAKKRDIKQATMQQLLTGQIRLPGFEGEWKLLNIANNSTLKARIGWQGLTTKEYLNSGHYGLITGTDFNGGKIVWEGCHFVEKDRYDQDVNIQLKNNDVLITKDGTIGKAAYIENLPFPATLNSGVFIIRPLNDSYEPKYFYYVLMSRFFTEFLNKLAAGSTISHLYQKDFLGFEFPAPPSRKEQLAIATILSDIDAEIEELVKRRAKTATLKKAMMQELLTGRTRLVNYCI